MVAIHYFASIRETLGRGHENMELPRHVNTVEELVRYLADLNGGRWAEALQDTRVMVAVNHTVVSRSAIVRAGDEIAFFPPVTGG